MERLEGRVALVTGAGSGIGRVTAQRLAERGCHLALVDRNAGGLADTAASLRGTGRRVTTYVADVSDADRMAGLAEEVRADHHALHVLVNNAGVTSVGAFTAERLEDIRLLVDVNVWGVVLGCRAFLPLLQQQDEAHIVNVSSMAGLLGLPHTASYALTKGAVKAFSEALRGELAGSPVGVSVVFPGTHRTGIATAARGAGGDRIAALSQGRLGFLMPPPTRVARAIVRAIERDRPRVVVGPDARLVDLAARLAPGRTSAIGQVTGRLMTH